MSGFKIYTIAVICVVIQNFGNKLGVKRAYAVVCVSVKIEVVRKRLACYEIRNVFVTFGSFFCFVVAVCFGIYVAGTVFGSFNSSENTTPLFAVFNFKSAISFYCFLV